MTKVSDPIREQMIDMVQTLEHKIAALKNERTKLNYIGRKFKAKNSTDVPITKGPDRGYVDIVWQTPELRDEYEANVKAVLEVTTKINSHRTAIRALEKWLKENK